MLSLALAVVMLLGAFPLAAFASDPHDDVFVKLENLISAIDRLEPAPTAITPAMGISHASGEVGDTIQVSFSNVMESWEYGGYYGDRWPNITAQGAAVAVCAVLDGNDPVNGTYSNRTDAPDNILRLLVAYDNGGYDRRDLQFAIWGISGAGNAGALISAAASVDTTGYVAYRWTAGGSAQPIYTLHKDVVPPEEGEDDPGSSSTRIEIETRVEVESTTTIENDTRYSEAWGQITIRKENQNHESLDGAQFDIRLEFANGEVRNIRNWEVDNGARLLTWQHPAGDISPVKVTVTEVRPPQHYSLDPTPQVATVAPTFTTFFIQTTRMWTTEMSFHYHLVFHIGGEDGGEGGEGAAAHSAIPTGAAPISEDGWIWIAENRDASGDEEAGGGEACPTCSHEFGPEHNSAQVGSDTQETASMTVGDRETTLTFRNVRERGQVIITKLCSVTSQPLVGAEFRVDGVDLGNAGSFSQTVTTGADGTATINGLFPGSYRVTEIGTPPTHNNDAPPQTFAVQSNETVRLTFRNTRRQGLQILKVDPEGNALQGAVFQVARGSGQVLGTYITDVNGLIVIPSNQLATGEYVATEIQAPDGFLIDTANNPQRIHVDNTQQNQNYQLTFRNFRMPSIEIIKVDANDPTIKLEGAVFRISNTMTGQRFEGTTDATGHVYFPRLDLNTTYIIEEIGAPAGHVNSGFRQEIVLRENRVHTIIVSNSQKPSLTIVKVDDVTGERLAGATFRLRAENGSFHDATTDDNGTAVISDLEPGTYTLVETLAPSGYILDNTSRTITVREGQHNEIRITNQKYPTLTLVKVDSVTESPLAGARFLIERLTSSGIVRIGEYTSNADGTIHLPQIAPGRYRITEIEAPAGFIIDRAVHEITIESGDNKLVITNTPRSPITIRKTDPDGKPLLGAEFVVRQMNGGIVGKYTTTHTGYAIVPDMEPGWYTVEEVRAPDGYVLSGTPQNVQLIEGRPATVTFVNHRRPTLQIVKIDEITGRPLAGAVFRLAETTGRFIGDYTSDGDGLVIIHDLVPGGYVLVETRAPDGYLINNTPRTIHLEAGRVHREEIRNTPLHYIRIVKKDANDGALLAGAIFRLLDDKQQEIDRGTTNRAGEVIFSGLAPGRYFIEEVRAPEGYLKSEEQRRVDLKGDRSLEIEWENTPLRDISVIKTDADNGDVLAGAVFRLLDSKKNEITRATTVSDGVIRFEQLAPGKYFLEEVTAPDGYLRSTEVRQIDLKSSADIEIEWKNTPLRDISVIKTDADNGNVLAGAVFRLLDSRKNEITRATTAADGVIRFEQLAPGKYFIEEMTAPDGYLRSTEVRQVDLTTSADIEIVWENTPLRDISVTKTDADNGKVLAGAVFRLLDNKKNEITRATTPADGVIRFEQLSPGKYFVEEMTTPDGYLRSTEVRQIDLASNADIEIVWENTPLRDISITKTDADSGKVLAGAVFRLLDSRKNEITRATTATDGVIRFEQLTPGRYFIEEVTAPNGYLRSAEVRQIDLNSNADIEIIWENTPLRDLIIMKTDNDSGELLAGAVFRLLDSRRSELARAITGTDGEARFERLAPGRYFIEEVTEPKGYVRSTELMQIDITASQNLTIEWENQRILGSIEITKLSSADHSETGAPKGSRLAGAVFVILDENMERVDKITTDRNGWARSKSLVPGRYAIREIASPSGYILNGEVFYAEIKKHGDIVRFEVLNVPEDINITVTKRGNEEAVAGDVIRYDFTNVKNDSNIPLHDFYFRDNLPPEVMLQSLHIPAWTHRTTYRVTYTTNLKQNPQVWQKGLHTANSYELNVTDLNLAASEYVTSFKLEFGTVPAGFAQDGELYIYTKVREELPHEHRFVNKVDVGGQSESGGDWHYARDSWATVVFSKPKGPLPRTGLDSSTGSYMPLAHIRNFFNRVY